MERDREESGLILHVQRLSTEDGPGIRSTVFFKQCPLACKWCHNPESLSSKPELQWVQSRCIGCRSCVGACPRGLIALGREGLSVDRTRCEGCGTCAGECPTNALELLGRRVRAEALADELARDRTYFDASSGGVTLSGGEPLAQAGFAAALLGGLKKRGIQTALDTSGFSSIGNLRRVLPDTDLVLFDLKLIDSDRHRAFTGQPNETILANLLAVRAEGRRMWIRTPLVPGATAARENLMGIGGFIAEHLDGCVERWDLCAFNNLCREQYRRLGIDWEYAGTPLMTAEELNEKAGYARSSGVDPGIVRITGAARRST
jgi:pyruvate formate lyase activating enzyme